MNTLHFILLFLGLIINDKTPSDKIVEIPVFDINFYLMGTTEIDTPTEGLLHSNIDYLNEEFEGKIKFRLNYIGFDAGHGYIPDLFDDYVQERGKKLSSLIEPIELKGGINIYLFETYPRDGQEVSMLGFTPILRAYQKQYESNSPRFDRMYIAYPGLIEKTTIVHEMGHFLGLSHPWDMNSLDLELMGLDENNIEKNHMNYHPQVESFTSLQLDRMQHFALQFRKYLISHIEYKSEF